MRTKRNEHGSIDTDGLPSFVKHRQILLCAFPSYDNNLAPTTITVWADGTRKTYHTPIQKYMKAFFHERGGDFLSAKCELEHSYAPIPLDSCHLFISYIAFEKPSTMSAKTCRHGYINYLAFAFSDFTQRPSLPNSTLITVKDFHLNAHHKLERFLPRLRRGNDSCFQLILDDIASVALHLYCANYLLTGAQREIVLDQFSSMLQLLEK